MGNRKPRFKPYYVWGVGWFMDTQLVSRTQDKVFGCLTWSVIIFLGLALFSVVLDGLGITKP